MPDVERTIRNRFVRIYAALAIVIIIGAVFVVVAVRDRNRAADGEDHLWRPGQIAAVEVLTAVVDQETGVRGFVITGDQKFLEPYTAGRQRSAQALDALRVLFRDEASVRSLVDAVATKLSSWQTQVADPQIDAARIDLGTARDLVGRGNGTPTFDELRTSLADLSAAIDRRWADSNEQSASAFASVVATAIAAGVILAAAAVLLLNRSRRWLTQAHTLEGRLRSTITTIQGSLLPAMVPDIDHVAVAVAYRPASSEVDVGGDFYDINISPAGLVTVSVGDVCGHDIHAAVVTGLVRHTINAASQHLIDPADVLRWANQAMNSNNTDGRFVSAAHAHLHPLGADGAVLLDLALAGHPFPILLPVDGGAPREIGVAGTLLGIVADPSLTTSRITLNPGDQVVFFTDGLIENSQPRMTTDDLLALVNRARGATAAETQANLIDRYDQFTRRAKHDDVVVVVIQLRSTRVAETDDSGISEGAQLESTQQRSFGLESG